MCITHATLPGPESAPPLHAMAPAFMAELQSMLSLWWSWLMMAASSKASTVHVVVYVGGREANECFEVGFQASVQQAIQNHSLALD